MQSAHSYPPDTKKKEEIIKTGKKPQNRRIWMKRRFCILKGKSRYGKDCTYFFVATETTPTITRIPAKAAKKAFSIIVI